VEIQVALALTIMMHEVSLNPADICTKLMPGGEKRNRIVSDILYYYDNEQEIIQEQG
jgi:hypothetical protein